MKKTKILVVLPLLLLAALLWAVPQQFFPTKSGEAIYDAGSVATSSKAEPGNALTYASGEADEASDQIVSYAMSLLGSPYIYAGITPDGFDCSGFITHVYGKFDVEVPHSSAMQAEAGKFVERENAQPGDLLIFTGTNADVREPGHVGIVISPPGDTIEFVHSSSNGGVKVSKVEGTRYDLRFLQARRIL